MLQLGLKGCDILIKSSILSDMLEIMAVQKIIKMPQAATSTFH